MGRKKIIDDETLLEHARSVFLQRGAFGSTKEIAERAGVSEAAIFKRYPTKAKLFLAALLPPAADPRSLVANEIEDPRGALEETGRRLLDYFREVIPTAMHLMGNPAITVADVASHFDSKGVNNIDEALTVFIQERASLGQLRVRDARASASLLVAGIHSLALYEMMGLHGGVDMGHAIPHFVDALWSGLAPP